MNCQKKLKAISTKGLTKDLINKFSILNEAKSFSSGIFQNYLVIIPAKKYIKNTYHTIFNGHCLMKNKVSTHKKVIIVFLTY